MKKNTNTYTYKRLVSLFTILFSLFCLNAFAQLPPALEKEYDAFNGEILKAFQIMNTKPEATALKEVAVIKARLIKQSATLFPKLNALPELTEEEDARFMEKTMSKPLYQDLMKLMADPAFIKKVSGSPGLLAEYNELDALLNMGDDEEEEEVY
ncbi:hypothetical protein KEM09_08265 [Carboxylicivirga mesophila]|uniref:Uncharacterized protein n=1 Tax=Carboxylicivirga mesophila TaxID=1166478 RepID=A0ABS5K8U3_9BACT|nr:hypothetical protein [Carboxylicivirga mesophila]MBS2211391.1 hypothetical protein [Carboxylicivirga mesophila]